MEKSINQAKKASGHQRGLSRARKPEDMTLEQWQRALRREFGRQQSFQWRKLGEAPVFSEFAVTNPATAGSYRVTVRGANANENHCTCPDFAINTLGTCKHIEFVLSRLEGRAATRKALLGGYHPPFSEVLLRYGSKREVIFAKGSECPDDLRALAAQFFDEKGLLQDAAYRNFDRFLMKAAATGHEVRCREDAVAFIAERRDRERRADKINTRFPEGIDSPAFDGLLKVNLFPYQREAALFAARAGRCLIGDDMGLGKTMEALGAVEIMAREFGVERVLIVCPTSLKHQWQQEIERASERPVTVIGGGRQQRQLAFAAESFFKVVNYDVIHRDLELIGKWEPDLVILDEAQRIKNWKTRVAQTVKRLKSEFAIVLTGTPLENRLDELHSIVEFVDRFRLGPMFRFLDDHQVLDDGGKVVGYRNLERIGKTLAPILLRRNKSQVALQLPERLENRFFVPMTEEQTAYHEENRETVARIVAKWRRCHFLSEADQRRLTCALQNMRMSCDSTYLLDQETDFGHKADEIVQLLDEAFEQPDAKAVIFSQWLRMHEVLQTRFKARPWQHVLFCGNVPAAHRGALVDQFRKEKDCRVFLSTDAGGTGLNLQHAGMVVNVDLPWNPAVLEQRIGRVHRFGQKNRVQVVNYVSEGTIEHGMLSLLEFKKSVFSGVLDGGPGEVFLGGSRLNKFMDTVEHAVSDIPRSMPEDSPAIVREGQEEKPLPEEARTVAAPGVAHDVWMNALSAGLLLLRNLGKSLASGTPAGEGFRPKLERDEKTGDTVVRLPRLSPDAAGKAAQGLQLLVEALGEIVK